MLLKNITQCFDSMFIDSVVWIGAKLKRDQWHEKSVPIINKFLNKEINIVYVTDYIILSWRV